MLRVLEWSGEHVLEIVIGITTLFFMELIALAITATVENENNKINEGTVIDKSYRGSYTTVTYTKVGDTQIPQNVYHSKSYNLEIQGEKDEPIVT